MRLQPPLKYPGGKSYLAEWILSKFPPRRSKEHPQGWCLYREPYFGGGAVLLRQDPTGISEAVNDLDGDLMNFWRCLQNPLAFRLMCKQLSVTPFSEEEWKDARNVNGRETDLDKAIAFFVKARQSRSGMQKDFATPTSRIRRGMSENVSAWLSAIDGLPAVHQRLQRVEIRRMPALQFIQQYDHADAMFYADPPYLHETRNATGMYREFEMSEQDHVSLLDTLAGIKGRFALSGYQSSLYSEAARRHGWNIHAKEIDNKMSTKKTKETKTEILVCNY